MFSEKSVYFALRASPSSLSNCGINKREWLLWHFCGILGVFAAGNSHQH
nr:hypothetical protein Iba_scaffold16317CG0030 [Ipomoea batatas]